MSKMKLFQCVALIFFMAIAPLLKAGMIVLEGNYMGKNIFVKNPFGGAGVGFCAFEVTINGRLSPDEVNQSAFEIDFGNHDIKLGDKVIINIKHKDDCSPEVLNPEVLKPKSTFNVQKISFSDDGVLSWTADNENGKLDYIVEQYRWNKWVKAGEVSGEGTPGSHQYSFQVTPHSGENKARVKQVDYTGKPRYSKTADYSSGVPEVTLAEDKFKGQIEFNGGKTLYEIFDRYGTLVKRGYDQIVDISNFEKGTYYVNYDNTVKSVQFK